MDRAAILATHGELTERLAGLLVSRGQTNAAAVNIRAQAFESMQSQGIAITAAREAATSAAARFEAEAADLTGQIEALRAQLHHLDQLLTHAPRPVNV